MKQLTNLAIAAMIALGSASPAMAGFSDTFTEGINSTYWTLTQTNPSGYTDSTGPSGLTLAYASGSGFQNITMTLNLQAALGVSQINGNFSTQIDISGVSGLGSAVDQIELHTQYADNAIFYDNLGTDFNPSNNNFGENYHVWNGAIHGYTPTSATSGTFVISRTGTTVSGYFDGTLIYSETEATALTSISFVLQNYSGSDPIRATYTNFSVTASAVPEPSSAAIAASGVMVLAGVAAVRKGKVGANGKPGRS